MVLSDEAKKNILNLLLERTADIADKEYQQRVWIRGKGPECDDFDEAVCLFFDHVDIISGQYKDFGLTDTQYHVLMKFRNAFEAFSDEHNWPPDFIDTPEWARIMSMAKRVLEVFHYQKKAWNHPGKG